MRMLVVLDLGAVDTEIALAADIKLSQSAPRLMAKPPPPCCLRQIEQ